MKSVVLLVSILLSFNLWAADDPSIKGDLRTNIQQSMSEFIKGQTVNGKIYLYDSVDGALLTLQLDKEWA